MQRYDTFCDPMAFMSDHEYKEELFLWSGVYSMQTGEDLLDC